MPRTDAVEAHITFPSEDLALQAADWLVSAGLIACGQVTPVTSIYAWENRTETEPEWLLTAKTTRDCLPALEDSVRAEHPYDVPQIVAVPILWGSQDYLDWIRESCAPPE